MKIAKLKVVRSVNSPGNVSLRGPAGRGHNDSPQAHITNAGFEDGEDVVLVLAEHYTALRRAMEDTA